MLPSPGTTLGRYVVFDLLGEGGMGAVYRAWDDSLDRIVALKVLLPSAAGRGDARARFLREARLAARINHPAVAHIYDVGEVEGTPFIAMEFVPGRQLREELGAPQAADRAVFLARQILDGLAEAHRQGVVHRDLKPENVLLSGRDQVKILDFGLAKPMVADPKSEVPSTKGLAGTPRYMAPEQFQGREVDRRTDIYALGVVLFEILSGHPAHGGDSFLEIAKSILEGPPPALDITGLPPALAATVEKAMERDPDRRFESADAMLAALAGLRGDSRVAPLPQQRSHSYLPKPRAKVLTTRARDQLVGFGTTNAEMAVELAMNAVEIDPDYALAHAILGEAAATVFQSREQELSWLDRAEKHVGEAERLDPALPDLRVARAKMLWNKVFNFPAETALRELTLALRIDGHHVGALRLWAGVTAHLGLEDLLSPAIERRLGDDPSDQFMHVLRVGMLLQRGEADAAIANLTPILRIEAAHEETVPSWLLAHAHLMRGDVDAANDVLDHALKACPEEPALLSMLALADALDGDRDSAHRLEAQSLQGTKTESHPHHAFHHLALMHAVLGEIDESLAFLRRAADEGFPCFPWFETDPFLHNLRRSEVGASFMRELGRRNAFFRREFSVAGWLKNEAPATE
ncbi:MAG: protein kinase [Myxococcota bacterium]